HSLRKRLYRQSHSNRPLRRLRFRTNRRYTSVQALFRPLDAQSTVLGILVLTCLYSLSSCYSLSFPPLAVQVLRVCRRTFGRTCLLWLTSYGCWISFAIVLQNVTSVIYLDYFKIRPAVFNSNFS